MRPQYAALPTRYRHIWKKKMGQQCSHEKNMSLVTSLAPRIHLCAAVTVFLCHFGKSILIFIRER